MKNANLILAAAVGAALGHAAYAQPGELEWFGTIYAKFLDGDRSLQGALYGNAETTPGESGGDQGQGIELELMFRSQVSNQVEMGGRIHSRFNKNYWANFGGFGVPDNITNNGGEDDPRENQYFKLRGAWARITPGYKVIDSATIGSNDFGLFDALTQGKYRYIDRDNASGLLFQGTAAGGKLRWDVARVSLPKLFAGPRFTTTEDSNDPATKYEIGDPAWTTQFRWSPTPDFNGTSIVTYVRDKEIAQPELAPGGDTRDGVEETTRYDNAIVALKAEYTGFDAIDLSAAYYWSDYDVLASVCDDNINGNCRFSPLLGESAIDRSWFMNLDLPDGLFENLTVNIQMFHIGADYMSVQSARRESDVLLTEGWFSTWGWGRPDYNFGNRYNGNSRVGIGYGGWDGESQQVVSLMADNDFTDFDEPYANDVHGYEGITIVPHYAVGDWELSGELSAFDYDTNWQACGAGAAVGYAAGCGSKYPRNEGTHAWGLGGDYRSAYAPYQDRETRMYGVTAKHVLDVGRGIDLETRFRYIDDEDDRVTSQQGLTDAYDGYPAAAGFALNPDWVPNLGLGGCVSCDDRDAEYKLLGFSLGYQLHPDLYGKVILERYDVSLEDGTIDVAPVAMGFEASNAFGYAEYLTGEHDKNRIGFEFNYFLSGVEFGATIDWFWGDYSPEFYVDQNGQRVALQPTGPTVATPLGNISVNEVDLDNYRLKAFMKVSF